MSDHAHWMNLALTQAAKGGGRTSPNPMVGCVIVKNGKLVATGYHRRAGGPHGEIVALKKAGTKARGADVYVNLEPCAHVGKTGPCADALIHAGVKRVFVAMRDPFPMVNGKGIARMRRAGITVEVGQLGARARLLNEAFVHRTTTGRPWVVAKIAQSLDGRVATRTGESQWITSSQARRIGHTLRHQHDAIVVGSGTVLADDPTLTCRVRGGMDPIRVVLDSRGRTSPHARVIAAASRSEAPTLILVSPQVTPKKRRALEKAGAEVITCPPGPGGLDPQAVLDHLAQRGVMSVLLEGGPTLIGAWAEQRLIHKVHLFVAPLLIGGVEALGSLGGRGPAKLADALSLTSLTTEPVGPDLHIVGYPRRTRD